MSLPLFLLSACQKRADVEVPESEPTSDTYELDQPITVSILVGPSYTIRPMAPNALRALGDLGDLSRTYSDEEKGKSTVNSHQPTGANDGTHDYAVYKSGLDYYKADWIRTLSIPELHPGDYEVTGMVPVPADKDFSSSISMRSATDADAPTKVDITFYRLPKDGILSFFVNARRREGQFSNDPLTQLSFDVPYITVAEEFTMLSQRAIDQWTARFAQTETWDSDKGKYVPCDYEYDESAGSAIFTSSYIPMYGRLYRVARNTNGHGLVASETADGDPKPLDAIYLERAVSLVSIFWDSPDFNNTVDHYFVDAVYWGKLPNVCSIVPNNWEGVKKMMADNMGNLEPLGTKQKSIPAYWDYRRNTGLQWQGGGVDDHSNAMTVRGGSVVFFTPENYPTEESKQSTIYVVMSKYNPQTGTVIEPRGDKVFELPFGEDNASTGFKDVHRNTWYQLNIKFKYGPNGVQPYIVGDWTNVEVEAEI